jgi:hypothetical protein
MKKSERQRLKILDAWSRAGMTNDSENEELRELRCIKGLETLIKCLISSMILVTGNLIFNIILLLTQL